MLVQLTILFALEFEKIGQSNEKLRSQNKRDTNRQNLSRPFSIVQEFLARAIRQEQEIKGTQIGNKDIKLSLFSDAMIVYIKGPKNSTPKLLEIINSLGKLTGYNINIKNSVAFL
jgi:hypothetical protein